MGGPWSSRSAVVEVAQVEVRYSRARQPGQHPRESKARSDPSPGMILVELSFEYGTVDTSREMSMKHSSSSEVHRAQDREAVTIKSGFVVMFSRSDVTLEVGCYAGSKQEKGKSASSLCRSTNQDSSEKRFRASLGAQTQIHFQSTSTKCFWTVRNFPLPALICAREAK